MDKDTARDESEKSLSLTSLPLENVWEILQFLSVYDLPKVQSTCQTAKNKWCSGHGWDLAWWRPLFCKRFLTTMVELASGGEDFPCSTWKDLYLRLSNVSTFRWKRCTSEVEKDRLVQTRTVPYYFESDNVGGRLFRVGGKYFFKVSYVDTASAIISQVSVSEVVHEKQAAHCDDATEGGNDGEEVRRRLPIAERGASAEVEHHGQKDQDQQEQETTEQNVTSRRDENIRYHLTLPRWRSIKRVDISASPQPTNGFSLTIAPTA